MNELKELLLEWYPALAMFLVGVSPSLIQAFRERHAEIKRERLTMAEVRRKVKERPILMMDPHKRKGLQPANQHPVPRGAELSHLRPEKPAAIRPKVTKTPPVPAVVQHKFFGSQLTIEGSRVAWGLSRKMHLMEIVGNQMFIDNNPWPINEGDLERIKQLVREGKIGK